VRSSLSVDWVGLATSKRSPGVAVLRLPCDFAGDERPGAQDAPRAERGGLYRRADTVHQRRATRPLGNGRGTTGAPPLASRSATA
jgi:hypothetical protein